ncbi:hypothetical protein ACIRD2_26560 [Streptomyces sp. NPDC093595]|uniref:hypothetical protein n=1 Tax=Streptomyces sp. NPDC093595 TaxID=3366045 RepID=UPI003826C672
MTAVAAAVAALPVAAPRTARGAARRRARRRLIPVAGHGTAAARALGIALFLGGLLALGFLCGGRAYAAESPESAVTHGQVQDGQVQDEQLQDDRVRATRHTTREAAGDTPEAVGDAAAHAARTVREPARSVPPVSSAPSAPSVPSVPSAGAVTRPVAESVVRPVAGRVLPPATEAVTTVTTVTAAAAGVTGSAVSGAGPAVAVLVQGVVGAIPDPTRPPTPTGLLPALPEASAEAGAHAPDAAAGAGADTQAGAAPQADPHRCCPARTTAAAARPYAGDTGSLGARGDRPAAALSAPAPVVPAPWGGAGHRTPGCAGDGGASRAGADQYAVTAAPVPYPGPVRGAGLPATVAPVHDRPHDVLEFPG